MLPAAIVPDRVNVARYDTSAAPRDNYGSFFVPRRPGFIVCEGCLPRHICLVTLLLLPRHTFEYHEVY